jgi:cobalt/nickel transport system permease protein
MSALAFAPMFAVHISDGILRPEWVWGGFALAALLALFGAWGIREEEIPRVSLLSAAFFVSSQIHVPLPGGTTAHLLLNGLLGVVLGRRALLAVPVGLLMQKVLFNHGGFYSLGVNACVIGLPALFASVLFARLRRLTLLRRAWFGSLIVAASTVIFGLTLVFAVTLLITNARTDLADFDLQTARDITLRPLTMFAVLIVAALAVWIERRLQNPADFYLGLVIGESTVLLTMVLNAVALIFGGPPLAHTAALLSFSVHLPLAVIEGIILGFTVGFLARVKPEMLGSIAPEKRECPVDVSS